jgi:hypothetical protein
VPTLGRHAEKRPRAIGAASVRIVAHLDSEFGGHGLPPTLDERFGREPRGHRQGGGYRRAALAATVEIGNARSVSSAACRYASAEAVVDALMAWSTTPSELVGYDADDLAASASSATQTIEASSVLIAAAIAAAETARAAFVFSMPSIYTPSRPRASLFL